MSRNITLSEEAFKALREEKRAGESDSDVLLRLRRDALAAKKDPLLFLAARHRPLGGSWDAAEEALGTMREADRRRMARRARR